MDDTPTVSDGTHAMTFTLIKGIEEEQAAWIECDNCNGEGWVDRENDGGYVDQVDCFICGGDEGHWHEAIGEYFHPQVERHGGDTWCGKCVTKSSILNREHGVCRSCEAEVLYNDDALPCDICNNTGAEPGTASNWRIK